jgi:hypothetical protein
MQHVEAGKSCADDDGIDGVARSGGLHGLVAPVVTDG